MLLNINKKSFDEIRNALLTIMQITGQPISIETANTFEIDIKTINHCIDFHNKYFNNILPEDANES